MTSHYDNNNNNNNIVCRAGCQVDRRASRCHSPGATTPARRPATVVGLPLVTSTDEFCATGVVAKQLDTVLDTWVGMDTSEST